MEKVLAAFNVFKFLCYFLYVGYSVGYHITRKKSERNRKANLPYIRQILNVMSNKNIFALFCEKKNLINKKFYWVLFCVCALFLFYLLTTQI